MKCSRMAVAALAAAVVLAGEATALELIPLAAPAPPRPAGTAPATDPAEPPLKAEVAIGGPARTVAAAGTTLKFDTSGSWQGEAALTFKDVAPPMRFTLTLAKMPNYNLRALTLASGRLSLAVGPATDVPSTRYFDARGRAMSGPEGAAYTVTARRWAGGEVDVEVKRAPGAALGKALTINWQSDLGHAREAGRLIGPGG